METCGCPPTAGARGVHHVIVNVSAPRFVVVAGQLVEVAFPP